MNIQINYHPKKFNNSNKIGYLAIDEKLEFSLNYEIWFFPDDISKIDNLALNFEKDNLSNTVKCEINESILNLHTQPIIVDNYKKKLQIIERNDPKLYKIRFFGFENNNSNHNRNESSMLNNKLFYSKNKNDDLNHIIKRYYVKDQFGNQRLINSFLTNLTIETFLNDYANKLFNMLINNENLDLKEKTNKENNLSNDRVQKISANTNLNKIEEIFDYETSLIDKFKPGIGKTIRSYMHFVGCIRYSDLDVQKEKLFINSPEFVLKNRKGSVYEHAILLACLIININNKKNIILIDFEKEKKQIINKYNIENSFNNKDLKNSYKDDFLSHPDSKSNYSKYKDSKYNKRYNSSREGNGSNRKYDKLPSLLRKSSNSSINEDNKEIDTKEVNDGVIENNQNSIINNYKRDKYYRYTRKELKILQEYDIKKPEIDLIEKKINIDGVIIIYFNLIYF